MQLERNPFIFPGTLKLDNSAIIHMASQNANWSNSFRLSVTLYEEIDREVLQGALTSVIPRFPSIAGKISSNFFWYHVKAVKEATIVQQEDSKFLCMNRKEIKECAFRVMYGKKQIIVEFFHSLTDGYGGLVFLKTLTAEYIKRYYHADIPAKEGVKDIKEKVPLIELEDSFQQYASQKPLPYSRIHAYPLSGTKTFGRVTTVTSAIFDTNYLLNKAHHYQVSLTALLTAVMVDAIRQLQKNKEDQSKISNSQKPIQIMIPVNLRNIFASQTLRNFTLYALLGNSMSDKLPETFEAQLEQIAAQLKEQLTPEYMGSQIATNVQIEHSWIGKLPLFIKLAGLKVGFTMLGERNSCLSLSNLGEIKIPEEMKSYIQNFSFTLSPRASTPYNCTVLSYNGISTITMTRDCEEAELEKHFFTKLNEI